MTRWGHSSQCVGVAARRRRVPLWQRRHRRRPPSTSGRDLPVACHPPPSVRPCRAHSGSKVPSHRRGTVATFWSSVFLQYAVCPPPRYSLRLCASASPVTPPGWPSPRRASGRLPVAVSSLSSCVSLAIGGGARAHARAAVAARGTCRLRVAASLRSPAPWRPTPTGRPMGALPLR